MPRKKADLCHDGHGNGSCQSLANCPALLPTGFILGILQRLPQEAGHVLIGMSNLQN